MKYFINIIFFLFFKRVFQVFKKIMIRAWQHSLVGYR